MAYDESLAGRIRSHIGDHPAVTEKKMFGGVAYMLQGNMAVGIHKDSLMVRVPSEDHDSILGEPGVSDFDLTGKKMRGWVLVGAEAIADEASLEGWINRGMDFAGSLPPK